MKKILILIILSSLILGCRTKQKAVSFSKQGKTEIERVKFDSVREESSKQGTKKIIDNTIQKKKDDFSGDIIIKGKSDSLNPLEFHNIVNGDTLQSISIKGNADYIINNHFQKSEESKTEYGKEENLNVIQKTARDIVSKDAIKKTAETVETKTKEIMEKGFSFGVWSIVIIVSVIALILLFIFLWFGKNTWLKDNFKKIIK